MTPFPLVRSPVRPPVGLSRLSVCTTKENEISGSEPRDNAHFITFFLFFLHDHGFGSNEEGVAHVVLCTIVWGSAESTHDEELPPMFWRREVQTVVIKEKSSRMPFQLWFAFFSHLLDFKSTTHRGLR